MSLLDKVNSPKDIKKLNIDELNELCSDIRKMLIETVSKNGGHLASNLGVVELTVALHKVFNSPVDQIVFDVGHQCYTHKILTGRKESFSTLRTEGGISGFTRPVESEHDIFSSGHSSTSISAAIGLAKAKQIKGEKGKVIAVIGDGALTGGMAYEALNNCANENSNLVVILNDNNMSISKNVGSMAKNLTTIRTSPRYVTFKSKIQRGLAKIPKVGGQISRTFTYINAKIRKKIYHSTVFEDLGFRYYGPIDGHDLDALIDVLNVAKAHNHSVLINVNTVKGKGYNPAEKNPTQFHGIGKFNIETGEPKHSGRSFSSTFGDTMCKFAENDGRICCVTAAMTEGTGLLEFSHKFPKRFFDVGIAEGHAVTFSAGLAKEGMIPFCNVYSSFMQRAYDMVIHDVALQKLHLILCLDRAGLVGEDGATHHGVFDLAYLRPIPNLVISSPLNEWDLRNLMYTGYKTPDGPFVIRYPRGKGEKSDWRNEMQILPIGKGRKLRDGHDIAVLTIGPIGNEAIKAINQVEQEGISVAHYDMIYLKPLDEELLHEVGKKFSRVVTIENGVICGGLGSAVLEFMADHGYTPQVKRIGVPDRFIEHGSIPELYKLCGMDADSIAEIIRQLHAPSDQ